MKSKKYQEKRKRPGQRRMAWSAPTEINVNLPTGKPLGADRGIVEFMRSEFME